MDPTVDGMAWQGWALEQQSFWWAKRFFVKGMQSSSGCVVFICWFGHIASVMPLPSTWSKSTAFQSVAGHQPCLIHLCLIFPDRMWGGWCALRTSLPSLMGFRSAFYFSTLYRSHAGYRKLDVFYFAVLLMYHWFQSTITGCKCTTAYCLYQALRKSPSQCFYHDHFTICRNVAIVPLIGYICITIRWKCHKRCVLHVTHRVRNYYIGPLVMCSCFFPLFVFFFTLKS